MIRRIFPAAILLILAVLVLVAPAFAGGWAVISLDELPGQMVRGQAYTLGFMVRQHGVTPMANLTPTIYTTNPASGDTLTVRAEPAGEVGHYQATLTFPSEGAWRWSIDAFTMQQPMPDLRVLPAEPAAAGLTPTVAPSAALALVIIGLLGAVLAVGLGLRSRSRRLAALAVVGLMLAGAGFIFINANASSQETAVARQNQALSPEKTGQALFVAKGCVTCHLNQRIDARYSNFSVQMGPDLSKFSADPDFLRRWLADPSAVKPNTRMPNLELSPDEIEALIAFLNSAPPAGQ
jgi:cytochrome c2